MTNYQPGPDSEREAIAQARTLFPPGLVGEVATFIYISAPYPNVQIALAGAIGMMAGICGQRYNTQTGAGLNQYIIVGAGTGRGKEAIADATGKVLAAAQGNVIAGEPGAPCVGQFKLPSHFASIEGLIKQLAKTPCGFSIQGEYGIKLKQMTAEKAPAVLASLKAGVLDLYGKSGDGKIVDPIVYSDTSKNTAPIISPSLTIIGETTFVELFESFNPRTITSGLLPRFLTFHSEAPRPYLNQYVGMAPWPTLVEAIRDIAALCAGYSKTGQAVRVGWDSEAQAKFSECERLATDYVNANRSLAHSELWNRAYVKALKLASLMAVGVNQHAPTITLEMATWAINLIAEQTNWLASKFENGEVGDEGGNEVKQRKIVWELIAEFVCEKGKAHKDEYIRNMANDSAIPQSYLLVRVSQREAFYNDRLKASGALRRVIETMVANDELIELAEPYLKSKYGRAPKAFAINAPFTAEFTEILNRYISGIA